MEPTFEQRKFEILDVLDAIEQEYEISTIHAIESGEHAFGFPSNNGQYTVCFIYHHPLNWYITPFTKKGSLSFDISDTLKVEGFDISTLLIQLHKAETPAHEWLNSPLVYRSHTAKFQMIQQFSAGVFNPATAYEYYIASADKHFQTSNRLKTQAFLYGVRSILCAKWIKEFNSAPPVKLGVLTRMYLEPHRQSELNQLIEVKYSMQEESDITHHLWQFGVELYHSESQYVLPDKAAKTNEQYDQLLRAIVDYSK